MFQVVVQGLYTTDNCHTLTMDGPVRCVALDPQYGKPRSGRRFIVGMFRMVSFSHYMGTIIVSSFLLLDFVLMIYFVNLNARY